jgi:hypothetical protein
MCHYCRGAASFNNRLNPTSTTLLVLYFSATLAKENQLRSGGLAGRYVSNVLIRPLK